MNIMPIISTKQNYKTNFKGAIRENPIESHKAWLNAPDEFWSALKGLSKLEQEDRLTILANIENNLDGRPCSLSIHNNKELINGDDAVYTAVVKDVGNNLTSRKMVHVHDISWVELLKIVEDESELFAKWAKNLIR